MNTASTLAAHPFEALGDACASDLVRARSRLIAARAHQRVKDSTCNRARVAECQAQIDALLDMYLEVKVALRSGTTSTDPAHLVA